MFKRAAIVLATALLGACHAAHRETRDVQGTPCAERFAQSFEAAGVDPRRGYSLRYAFEVRRDDPNLLRVGIEGTGAVTVLAFEGPNRQAMIAAEVGRRMAPTVAPANAFMIGQPSWLVYAPTRSFAAPEVRAHLAAMCALSTGRGLILQQASFMSREPTS